jgi:hypothetical protein
MLDLSNFLIEVRSAAKQIPVFARMSVMLTNMQDAINSTANAAGVDSTQQAHPPDPPQGINVKASNGVAHVTITDHSQRSRALHYFVEASTTPAFNAPHVFHLGASRGAFIPLPGKTDAGATQNWYFKTYSAYPGSSQTSTHQVLGGSALPTAVNVGGTTQLTPLASTGAGTASTLGVEGGKGFGPSQYSQLPSNIPKQP